MNTKQDNIIRTDYAEIMQKSYIDYAMSVIISRALPEIDGFKPSHRKLLYTMYKMGLLTGGLTKSANVVGQTMRLNPHGDSAIYETMVRLARGNEALLHPYVQSKGNFGKAYSKDMAYAASRYTEVKLEPICNELFRDIDKDTVDFVPNYDNTMQEPTLFPATFPTVLVNANVGIAVSMASSVCPFNLAEVCETTIAVLKNPKHDILSTLKGPDFPGGGFLFYNETELQKIYDTGRGSVTVRAKWNYNKQDNCLEVTEIPYSTTIEAIKAYRPSSNSLSSGQVLHCPYEADKAKLVIREMTDLLVLDLVDKGLVTDQMVLTVGYDIENLTDPARRAKYHGAVETDHYGRQIPKQAHGSINLDGHTSSTRKIMCAVSELFDRIVDKNLLVRRMYVVANHVLPEADAPKKNDGVVQLDLFTDYAAEEEKQKAEDAALERERKIQAATLAIKKKYGKNAILKAMNLEEGATAKDRNAQIGGHKA